MSAQPLLLRHCAGCLLPTPSAPCQSCGLDPRVGGRHWLLRVAREGGQTRGLGEDGLEYIELVRAGEVVAEEWARLCRGVRHLEGVTLPGVGTLERSCESGAGTRRALWAARRLVIPESVSAADETSTTHDREVASSILGYARAAMARGGPPPVEDEPLPCPGDEATSATMAAPALPPGARCVACLQLAETMPCRRCGLDPRVDRRYIVQRLLVDAPEGRTWAGVGVELLEIARADGVSATAWEDLLHGARAAVGAALAASGSVTDAFEASVGGVRSLWLVRKADTGQPLAEAVAELSSLGAATPRPQAAAPVREETRLARLVGLEEGLSGAAVFGAATTLCVTLALFLGIARFARETAPPAAAPRPTLASALKKSAALRVCATHWQDERPSSPPPELILTVYDDGSLSVRTDARLAGDLGADEPSCVFAAIDGLPDEAWEVRRGHHRLVRLVVRFKDGQAVVEERWAMG